MQLRVEEPVAEPAGTDHDPGGGEFGVDGRGHAGPVDLADLTGADGSGGEELGAAEGAGGLAVVGGEPGGEAGVAEFVAAGHADGSLGGDAAAGDGGPVWLAADAADVAVD